MRALRAACAGFALAALVSCGGKTDKAVRSAADAPVVASPAPLADWHRVVTAADRARLREWRTAWLAAVAGARRDGAANRLVADAPLYAFDTALRDPVPPAGEYRCRTIKLGAKAANGLGYVAYPFFRCRVTAQGGTWLLDKLTGSQRASGTIYPHDTTRAVFLGTMVLGDERGAVPYGRDTTRDMAGWVERIGTTRWRLALPYPAFESTLDVVELVPA